MKKKVVLLKDLVKEHIDTQKIKDVVTVTYFEYFRHNLIYSRGHNISIQNKLKNVVGFFLMNTLQFIGVKKKRGFKN